MTIAQALRGAVEKLLGQTERPIPSPMKELVKRACRVVCGEARIPYTPEFLATFEVVYTSYVNAIDTAEGNLGGLRGVYNNVLDDPLIQKMVREGRIPEDKVFTIADALINFRHV